MTFDVGAALPSRPFPSIRRLVREDDPGLPIQWLRPWMTRCSASITDAKSLFAPGIRWNRNGSAFAPFEQMVGPSDIGSGRLGDGIRPSRGKLQKPPIREM